MLPNPVTLKILFGLSERQAQVALLLAQRRTNKEIAQELGFTCHCAERHTEKVLAKLGIRSRRSVEGVIRTAR